MMTMTKGLALMLILFTLSMYLSAGQVLNSTFIEAIIIKVQMIHIMCPMWLCKASCD